MQRRPPFKQTVTLETRLEEQTLRLRARNCAVKASRNRAGLRERTAMKRDLYPGVAHLGPEVEPVDIGQLLAGDQPEPEMERHG